MQKILSLLAIVFMSFSAIAEHHGDENADLHAAIKAFDHAYANNEVEKYFSFYADDATAYFGFGGHINVGSDCSQFVECRHESSRIFQPDGRLWITLTSRRG